MMLLFTHCANSRKGVMTMRHINIEEIEHYRHELMEEEKSTATIDKYMRDIGAFLRWMGMDHEVSKECVIQYKEYLKEHYKVTSVNSMLVALNRFFQYLGWSDCCVKGLKAQRQMFSSEARELKQEEYEKLVETARRKHKEQLALIIETITGTGIRISELVYITAEAVQQGKAEVSCKGKWRQIYLTKELRKRLMKYCRQKQIKTGPVFCTRTGNPLDRSNIWSMMKRLSKEAGVNPEKVFPHNLRHLFARVYYKKHKDIFYLADILGHASVNTTRIYTRTVGENHIRMLEGLKLVI